MKNILEYLFWPVHDTTFTKQVHTTYNKLFFLTEVCFNLYISQSLKLGSMYKTYLQIVFYKF